MATQPATDEPEQTPTQRVAAAVAAPITERTPRTVALLVVSGAVASLAPFPFGILGAGAAVAAAFELGRKR